MQKNIKLADAAVQLKKSRNEALEMHNKIMLFSIAPAQCSESETVEFFNILRAEALRNARARALTNSDQNESKLSLYFGVVIFFWS